MTPALFFERLETHFKTQLPFVAYRKPNETKVHAILQLHNELHFVKDFTEQGFVFSPFDAIDETVFIPLQTSEIFSVDNFDAHKDVNANKVFRSVSIEDKAQHIALVKQGKDAIVNGHFEKVVLSRQESHELSDTEPISIFKRLLNAYPKGFVYCWYHPKVGLWLGATPETLVKIEGHRFSIMALAGTQQYMGTEVVVWQQKELEEQQYVTDFVTEQIQTLVENITVSEVETVRSGNLLHLKSTIAGTINPKSINLKHLLSKLHPTPAVCGVPKHQAKQFILENEGYDRAFYTGFLGELNFEKNRQPRSGRRNIEHRAYTTHIPSTQLYVNLRCMQLKHDKALIYVGGGVTKLSNPEHEWEETVSKAMIIKTVL